jgi:hypothetical protein
MPAIPALRLALRIESGAELMADNPCPTCGGKGGAYLLPEARWHWCETCRGDGAAERAVALEGAAEGCGIGIRHDSSPRRLFGD